MFRRQSCSGNILQKISQAFRKEILSVLSQLIARGGATCTSRERIWRNFISSANCIVRTIGRIGFATDSQHMRRTRGKCHAASVVAARAWQCALSRRVSSPGVLRLCIIDPTHGPTQNARGHVSRALTSNWRNKPPRKTAAARLLSFRYTLSARKASLASEFTLRYNITPLTYER